MLNDWVELSDGDNAPRIRHARSITGILSEGTRKRCRASETENAWCIGDKVEAWMRNSWWEGIIIDKGQTDATLYTVHFPGAGKTSEVRAWHLRSALIWLNNEWVEWSSLQRNFHSFHSGDTPHGKRRRLLHCYSETSGRDKIKESDAVVSDKASHGEATSSLPLCAGEATFNIGRRPKYDIQRKKPTPGRKERQRAVFDNSKSAKIRKFTDTKRKCISDMNGKIGEGKIPSGLPKYPVTRKLPVCGWRNFHNPVTIDKLPVPRPALSDPTTDKRSREGSSFRRNPSSSSHREAASLPTQMASARQATSESLDSKPKMGSAEDTACESGSRKLGSRNTQKAHLIGESRDCRATTKPVSDGSEPRRSNRRIQPTSRLLEGIQSSLMVSRVPPGLHDKTHRSKSSRGAR